MLGRRSFTRVDAALHPPAGETIVDLGQIIGLGMLLIALGLLVGGPVWMMRRAAALRAAQEAEAAAFEREAIASMRRSGAQTPARVPLSPAPESPGAAPASAPPSTPTVTVGASGGLSPLARSVIDKLEVAGASPTVEGPLRTANPAIRGALITIRGNLRIGILDSTLDRDDPALGMLIRHLDAIVVSGPGDEPLLVKQFQSLIGDLFKLG
jgi:type II secretory pathway pseudopilin PulG